MHTVLVTGVAGFIGFHLAQRLLNDGKTVFGIDNLNDYYDVNLKKARLRELEDYSNFKFSLGDISDNQVVLDLFSDIHPEIVINLAAQVGIRYSLINPNSYIESNIVGFANILEGCRQTDVKHLLFASSSSVYGANSTVPYSIDQNVNRPICLYAATKKSNELMAYAYSHLYDLPVTGIRFFTIYGPWGRPDMSYFKFTKAILEGNPIDVYNEGNMKRDFTYVDDAVDAVVCLLSRIPYLDYPQADNSLANTESVSPYRIYNVGSNRSIDLLSFVEILENYCGKEATKIMLPLQPGDMIETYADLSDLEREFGFQPKISIEEGLHRFVDWFRHTYPSITKI